MLRSLPLLALAGVALFSQDAGAFRCQSSAGTTVLRGGGAAELLGDVRLDCTGGTGTVVAAFVVSAPPGEFYPTTGVSEGPTEAYLAVGDPAVPLLGENIFAGVQDAYGGVRFTNVSIPAPGAGRVRLRVVNLRRYAATHCHAHVQDPKGVRVSLSGSSQSDSIAIEPRVITAGFCANSHQFQLLGAGNVQSASPSWNGSSATFTARFAEGTSSSFKRRNVATTPSSPLAVAPQQEFGRDYGTESGFYVPSVSTAGLAGSGTRLSLSFSNVPAGVTLSAALEPGGGSSSSIRARRVDVSDTGQGPFVAVSPGSTGMAPVPVLDGSAQIVWEVLSSDPEVLETLEFAVSFSGAHSGTIGMRAGLAPFNVEPPASGILPIPRFEPSIETVSSRCGVSCLQVPSAIVVSYTIGGTAPAPIQIPILASSGTISFQAQATMGVVLAGMPSVASPSWLTLPVSSGTTPNSLTATINPAGLTPGQYMGRIAVTSGSDFAYVLVLLTVKGGAGTAPPAGCATAQKEVTIIRDTGLAERVADLVLTCDPSPVPRTVQVTATLSHTITSRPADVMLLVNDPAPSAQAMQQNVFAAEFPGDATVRFSSVAIPAGSSQVTLRIVNLRVNASKDGPGDDPAAIRGLVTVDALPVSSGLVTLARRARAYQGILVDPLRNPAQQLDRVGAWTVVFAELFRTSFQKRNAGTSTATPNTLLPQDLPGISYNSETGFYGAAIASSGGIAPGLATQGTRLMAKFLHVPPGAQLSVSVNEKHVTARPKAQLVQTDPNGDGAFVPVSGPMAQLPVQGGSAVAVWELLDADPTRPESLEFDVAFTGTGSALFAFELAPISSADYRDSNAPIPRFNSALAATPRCPAFPCPQVPDSIQLASDGTSAAEVPISVGSEGGPTPFVVSTPTVPWLTVLPPAGVAPASIVFRASPDGMAAGNYSTTVDIGGKTVQVHFALSGAGRQALFASPSRISSPVPGSAWGVFVQVGGTPGLTATVSASVPWIELASSTVTVPTGLHFTLRPGGLPWGSYEGRITVTATGAEPLVIPVQMFVGSGAGISGTVRDASGTPVRGVAVMSGHAVQASRATVTDENGLFTFRWLGGAGPYVVTPVAAGRTFSPASRLVTPDVSGPADFVLGTGQTGPTIGGASPLVATSNPQVFTVIATDGNGAMDIQRVYFSLHTAPAAVRNGCHGFFDRAANALFLYDDQLASITGPLAPGSGGTIENSQCRLLGQSFNSTRQGLDDALTLRLQVSIERKAAFGGVSQKLYLWAVDNQALGTGWVESASWTAGSVGLPELQSASVTTIPSPGIRFAASAPGAPLRRAYFTIAASPVAEVNGCHGFYDYAAGSFYLYNDSLTAPLGPAAAGAPTVLSNSQCELDAARSAFNSSAGEVTIALTRKGVFRTQRRNAYLWLVDAQGAGTGWLDPDLVLPGIINAVPRITVGTIPESFGATRTLTAIVQDSDGLEDLHRIYFLVNPTPSVPANSCHGFYDVPSRTTYLYNDALTAVSSTSLENSQCAVSSVTVSRRTTDLVFGFDITRKGSYLAGTQDVYLWATDRANSGTGWVLLSAWSMNANRSPVIEAPTVQVVKEFYKPFPDNFVSRVVDDNGVGDVSRVYFLFNSTPTIPSQTCHGFYDRTTGRIFLYNDDLTGLLAPITLGTSTQVSNAKCTVFGTASSASAETATRFRFTLSAKLADTAPTNFYVWAVDHQNAGTGWVHVARYEPIAPPANSPPTAGQGLDNYLGSPVTLTLHAQDEDGFADINRVYFVLNTQPAAVANGCHGFYDRPSNTLQLLNDNLSGLASDLSNNQCSIAPGSLRVTNDAKELFVTFTVALEQSFGAQGKYLYVWVVDSAAQGTGWHLQAIWRPQPNLPPSVVPVQLPIFSGPGPKEIAAPVSDLDGIHTVSRIYFLVANTPATAVAGCHGFFETSTGALYLYNDALTQPLGPGSPGNSQCSVSGPSASFPPSNTTSGVIRIPITLTPGFLGAGKKVYLWAVDNQGLGSGWVRVADWNP